MLVSNGHPGYLENEVIPALSPRHSPTPQLVPRFSEEGHFRNDTHTNLLTFSTQLADLSHKCERTHIHLLHKCAHTHILVVLVTLVYMYSQLDSSHKCTHTTSVEMESIQHKVGSHFTLKVCSVAPTAWRG